MAGNYLSAYSEMYENQRKQAVLAAERNKLTTEYQTAYDEAKASNEGRYEDVLGQYQNRYDLGMADLSAYESSILGGLEGLGEAEKAQISRTYAKSGASAAQSLVNSGLHSTTIAPAVQRQNAIAESNALSLADERLRRENLGYKTDIAKTKLGYTTGLSKDLLDFMERRTDTYPDQSVYINLMSQLGNTGN